MMALWIIELRDGASQRWHPDYAESPFADKQAAVARAKHLNDVRCRGGSYEYRAVRYVRATGKAK